MNRKDRQYKVIGGVDEFFPGFINMHNFIQCLEKQNYSFTCFIKSFNPAGKV